MLFFLLQSLTNSFKLGVG